jgi:hypothetical protein
MDSEQVSAPYRLHSTESHLWQVPIHAEAALCSTFSSALCIFICRQFGAEMVEFLVDHIRFDFENYDAVIPLVLELLWRRSIRLADLDSSKPRGRYVWPTCIPVSGEVDTFGRPALLLAERSKRGESRRETGNRNEGGGLETRPHVSSLV